MALRIVEHSGLTDTGRQRQSNEDRFLDAAPVFAVADGMGGARAGEVASRIALEAFASGGDTDAAPETQLAEIARAANRRIWQLSQEDEARAGMGTTLTAVIVADREVAIGHVGDSRLYRLRDGGLERLTTDHSLVEELVRRGELAPDEAESHPQKSIITRALGPEPDVEVETFTCAAQDGDVYLLCSDGLTGMVSEDDVAAILRESPSLDQGARALVDAANRAGGKDNITVVLFRLGAGDEDARAETDTLSGSDTQAAVDAAEVRAAVAAAEAERGSTARHPVASGPDGPVDRDDATIVVGGTIPKRDVPTLQQLGVAAVFPVSSSLDEIVDFAK
nr:Stp1/IreP family PP2C-type Ser/Thr phosphatase [Actinomycetota bacterium]